MSPLLLTLRLAAVTTVVLLLLGTPLAWWLARTRWRGRAAVEAVVALPLVLPPTVLGFYLLLLLAPRGPLGALWGAAGGEPLVFSFTGLVIGSVLYSLPFVVQPLQGTFAGIDARLLEAAAALGAGPWRRFGAVVLPLSRGGLLTAATLGFAHTVGEFGVVLMLGGNVPGETRVVSIAVYDHVEALEYAEAHRLAALLMVFSFVSLLAVYGLGRRAPEGRRGLPRLGARL
jgi:molybdate transport system permease protein